MALDSGFDFNHLFTFEMANNHQGSVEHGVRIIDALGVIAEEQGIRSAVKLQFRDLDTFIHPEYRDRKDVKHIQRFLSTCLSHEDFRHLVNKVKERGMITMATPFDEASVDTLVALGVEIIKIGSCSAQDWPLLEKVATAGLPVIISIAGLSMAEIDAVVHYLDRHNVQFAMMHCVAIYPTPEEKLQLNSISILKKRYPHLTIGFSTHESPDNTAAIGLAYAKGARIFEKHVGIATDTITLNAYSATPEQVRSWIVAYKNARASFGDESLAPVRIRDEAEVQDLQTLKRCVFAKKSISKGEVITREAVMFAMPLLSSEFLTSGQWGTNLVADKDYGAGEPIHASVVQRTISKRDILIPAIFTVKSMLREAQVSVAHECNVEVSHHYGVEHFNEVGCFIVGCINREYAKKILIQLPGQRHPIHYHKIKDETFYVLDGSIEVDIEGKKRVLNPGDSVWIPRGVRHGFKSDTGAVIEEVSTADLGTSGDSYYIDPQIAKQPRDMRKTYLANWGRYQFE